MSFWYDNIPSYASRLWMHETSQHYFGVGPSGGRRHVEPFTEAVCRRAASRKEISCNKVNGHGFASFARQASTSPDRCLCVRVAFLQREYGSTDHRASFLFAQERGIYAVRHLRQQPTGRTAYRH